jgi:hypothetical protein
MDDDSRLYYLKEWLEEMPRPIRPLFIGMVVVFFSIIPALTLPAWIACVLVSCFSLAFGWFLHYNYAYAEENDPLPSIPVKKVPRDDAVARTPSKVSDDEDIARAEALRPSASVRKRVVKRKVKK